MGEKINEQTEKQLALMGPPTADLLGLDKPTVDQLMLGEPSQNQGERALLDAPESEETATEETATKKLDWVVNLDSDIDENVVNALGRKLPSKLADESTEEILRIWKELNNHKGR